MISAKKTELKDIYGMTRSQIRKYAFIKSIPIMCSYIFVSMAYGIMMDVDYRITCNNGNQRTLINP